MQQLIQLGTVALALIAGTVDAQVTPATPAAIVQAQVEAFNRGDAPAFAALYAEDVELFDLGPDPKPTLAGRAALLARYAPLLGKYHPQAQILSRIENGDFVIDHERTTAAGRTSDGVAIYQIAKGKICRVWFTP